MRRRRLALAALLVILVAPATASAEAQHPVSLTVSGGPGDVTLAPGASSTAQLTVRNPATYTQHVEVELTGLTVQGTDYSMVGDVPRSLAVAATPQTFDIPPKSAQDVQITVAVRTDAEPGGQYAGIVVRGVPHTTAGQSPVVGEIALPILVRVPGDVVDSGHIRSFAPRAKSVVIGDEVAFTLAFANTGNVHYPVKGTVELFEGPRAIGVIDVPEGPVLPGTVRSIPIRWTGVAPAGTITARLRATWGADGKQRGERETTVRLVESASSERGRPRPVLSLAGDNVTWPALLALLLLLLMLALLFRSSLQRDRDRRA